MAKTLLDYALIGIKKYPKLFASLKDFELKTDKFRKARGNYSRLYNLFCRACGTHLAVYQKDGPGNLRRLYFDRIFYPPELTKLRYKLIKKILPLVCKKCKEELGVPYVYKKEKRKAFKLYQDAVIRKLRKQ